MSVKIRETGLAVALLCCSDDARETWGWWCPTCSTRLWTIGQDGFETRDGARRAGVQHEKRRGHR